MGVVNHGSNFQEGMMMEPCESTNPRGDCDSSSSMGDDELRVRKFLHQRVMVNFFYSRGVGRMCRYSRAAMTL